MALKITKWDKVFSEYIRERDDWTCQRCGVKYNKNSSSRRGLHCSHYIGRSNWKTRLEPTNAMALCYGCHRFVGSNPMDHHELWMKRFDIKKRGELLERKNDQTIKKRDVANDETLVKLKGMLKELKDRNI